MARGKPIVSRTFAPIHFEDLDPHRFEDLIRELIYDFRDWQSIEATGRSGADAGFDIRAFERTQTTATPDEQDDAEEQQLHPMDGPQWMIQGKREKTLTPSDVKKILSDIDAENPPYGYILAASAVFSKKSYDVFRDELRKKGVMEFYLWGRPELEDMLHLPKNDRILFTFFGVSLVSRRRSRSTEVRAAVSVKNKLYKVLGSPEVDVNESVLIRDINDANYPFRGEYADFDKSPRWIERTVLKHHPKGLIIHNREYFAFVDRRKKEWDYTEHTDSLVGRRAVLTDAEREEHTRKQQEVFAIWNFLPRSQQGTFSVEAFLPYADVLLVDAEGDAYHKRPHLYAEFSGVLGPYSGARTILSVKSEEIELDGSWRRIEFFPKTFSGPAEKPHVHRAEKINLDAETLKAFVEYREPLDTLYAADGRYDFLRQRDIIAVANTADRSGESNRFVQVLHMKKCSFIEYLNEHPDQYHIRLTATRQVGREIADEEQLTILEVGTTWLARDE